MGIRSKFWRRDGEGSGSGAATCLTWNPWRRRWEHDAGLCELPAFDEMLEGEASLSQQQMLGRMRFTPRSPIDGDEGRGETFPRP